MKRTRALFALAAALLLGAAPAAGQGKTKPAASAQPGASATAQASASAMPAGHPPVAGGMPAGHPGTGGTGDEDEEAEDPHARGAARAADPRFFTPPEDVVSDDPSLPAGTVVVTIKDAQDKPLPRAPITLGVLHSTVAKGDSNEKLTRDGDENGAARFDGLAFGSGHTYRPTTTRGSATYGHPPFALTDKVGKRVTVHAYEVSANLDDLPIAMQGMVYVSLREDAIQVEQLVSVYNLGPVSWSADATMDLPKGFKAFTKQDTMDDARVEEVPGGAALRGTFPPGRRELDFRYQVPLDEEAKQTLHLRLPPRVAQIRVIAEASRNMTLDVPGFPPAQRVDGRDGKHLLVTELQVSRSAGGLAALEFTLSGLPTQGPGRWIAVVLAVFAFGGGLFYFLTQGSDGAVDADALRDLTEAREALLAEIVALERAHRTGEIGPKTYARVRTSLLDALARIVGMIDDATPKKKARPKAARVEELST